MEYSLGTVYGCDLFGSLQNARDQYLPGQTLEKDTANSAEAAQTFHSGNVE